MSCRFYEETVSTLKFAEEVKKVRNRAVANENVSGENVTVLLREIDRLKGELRRVNANSPRVVEIPTEEELTQLRTDRARLEKALRASEIENGELREKVHSFLCLFDCR
jgi:kinesin family protein 1